jgi:hypothetical protein
MQLDASQAAMDPGPDTSERHLGLVDLDTGEIHDVTE